MPSDGSGLPVLLREMLRADIRRGNLNAPAAERFAQAEAEKEAEEIRKRLEKDDICEAVMGAIEHKGKLRKIYVAADPDRLLFFRDPERQRKFLGKKK